MYSVATYVFTSLYCIPTDLPTPKREKSRGGPRNLKPCVALNGTVSSLFWSEIKLCMICVLSVELGMFFCYLLYSVEV